MLKLKKTFFTSGWLLLAAGSLVFLTGCGQVKPGNVPTNGQNNNQNNNDIQNETVRPIDERDHLIGSLSAPVKMIVYSDFECPYCANFAETMKQVEEAFKDKVAIVFRHYPVAGHQEAQAAAEASECAAEQNKFWEMHDKLFADNRAGRLGTEQYKKDAGDLKLDTEKFNQCLADRKYRDRVEEEKTGGNLAGVSGTPTIFINNNIYPGAYPFKDFTSASGDKEAGLENIINGFLQ